MIAPKFIAKSTYNFSRKVLPVDPDKVANGMVLTPKPNGTCLTEIEMRRTHLADPDTELHHFHHQPVQK